MSIMCCRMLTADAVFSSRLTGTDSEKQGCQRCISHEITFLEVLGFFLIAPFADHCLLVLFSIMYALTKLYTHLLNLLFYNKIGCTGAYIYSYLSSRLKYGLSIHARTASLTWI